jgi:hypothetical protein
MPTVVSVRAGCGRIGEGANPWQGARGDDSSITDVPHLLAADIE